MNHNSKSEENQAYAMYLNIMEPPRMPGPGHSQLINNPKCCECCKSYGTTIVSVESEKNFAMTGETIKISGNIDHSKGNERIKEALIKLE